VKQILLCPSLHCNQIFTLLCKIPKSNEDSFSKLNKIYKNKISKGKKHEKRKQPQEKSSTSGKKIVVVFSFHVFFLLIFCFYIFYSVLKMNLHCFSAVLSNETGNHFRSVEK
jgi:hypothetical protein